MCEMSSPMKQSTYTWSTPFFDIEFVDIRTGRNGRGRAEIGHDDET